MILILDNILKKVKFTPQVDQFQLSPHAIDIRLAEPVVILPGSTSKGKSMETIEMPNDVIAVVYPRSSTNRRGLEVHMTGIVDANYKGQLIIPITNHSSEPVTLLKGERIASLVFHSLEQRALFKESKYHNSDGEYKPDKTDEMILLQEGNIEVLKSKYSIKI